MELCRHAIGQYLTRCSDSLQVEAMVVVVNQGIFCLEYDHSKSQATEGCKESCHGQTKSL